MSYQTLDNAMMANLGQLQSGCVGISDDYYVDSGPRMSEIFNNSERGSCDCWGGGCSGGCAGCDSYD
jgi:hypothetical protein